MPTESRVLLDATAIPGERGGVGRSVDNLVQALDAGGGALSVVCQHAGAETFAPLAPLSRVILPAEELGSRPAGLAWEQTTLPRLARRIPAGTDSTIEPAVAAVWPGLGVLRPEHRETGAGDIDAPFSDLLEDPERRAALSEAAVERARGAASPKAHREAHGRAAAADAE